MFVFLSILTTTMVYGQGMTDTQVLQFIMKEKKSGTADNDIATKLLRQGATIDQIQRLRQKYSKQLDSKSLGGWLTRQSTTHPIACVSTMVPCARLTMTNRKVNSDKGYRLRCSTEMLIH